MMYQNNNYIERYGIALISFIIQSYLYWLIVVYKTYSFDYILKIYSVLLFGQVAMNTLCYVTIPFENKCKYVSFISHLFISCLEFCVILYYNIYIEIPLFVLCLFIISFANTMIEDNNYRFICDIVFTIMKTYVFISYYMENVLEFDYYTFKY